MTYKNRINDENEAAENESDSTPGTNDKNLQINKEPVNYNVTINSSDSKSSRSKGLETSEDVNCILNQNGNNVPVVANKRLSTMYELRKLGKKFTRGETFFGTLKTCQLYEIPQKPLIRFEDAIQGSIIEEEKINPIEFQINQYQPQSYKSGGNTLVVYENRDQDSQNRPQQYTSTSNTSTFIIKEPMFLAFDERSLSKKGKEESSSQSNVNSSSKNIISRNQNEFIKTHNLKGAIKRGKIPTISLSKLHTIANNNQSSSQQILIENPKPPKPGTKANVKLENLENSFNIMRGSTFAIQDSEKQLEVNAASESNQKTPSHHPDTVKKIEKHNKNS